METSTPSENSSGTRRSLEQKRKSVEEKLNAVLEKQLSRDAEKQQQNALRKQISHDPSSTKAASPLKPSVSTGDIKAASRCSSNEEARSDGESSPRNDSLENFDAVTPVKVEDTVDRARDNATVSGSSVNVSVVTSTPVKSDVKKSGSGDIVVITGKKFYL